MAFSVRVKEMEKDDGRKQGGMRKGKKGERRGYE